MSRGGFFAGGDYERYTSGTLSYTTPTSRDEFKKKYTKICPKCRREVPAKAKCVFCDHIFYQPYH